MERENVHGWTGSRRPEGETTTNTEERRRSIETTNCACFCVVVLCVPFVRSPVMHTLCDSPYACLDGCLSQHPTGRRRHCWYVSFCFCLYVEIGRAREKGKSPTPTSPCLVGLYPPKYQSQILHTVSLLQPITLFLVCSYSCFLDVDVGAQSPAPRQLLGVPRVAGFWNTHMMNGDDDRSARRRHRAGRTAPSV